MMFMDLVAAVKCAKATQSEVLRILRQDSEALKKKYGDVPQCGSCVRQVGA